MFFILYRGRPMIQGIIEHIYDIPDDVSPYRIIYKYIVNSRKHYGCFMLSKNDNVGIIVWPD